MADIEPGWYDDTEDPKLARWWDGRAWTRHTLVIADQVPGTDPPPPVDGGTRFPVPPPAHEWLDDPAYADEPSELDSPDDAHDPSAYAPLHTAAPATAWAAQARQAVAAVTEPPTQTASWAWPPVRQVDHDETWHRLDDVDDEPGETWWSERRRGLGLDDRRRRSVGGDETLGERIRELPFWVRVALPVLAIVLLAGAVASAAGLGSDGDGGGATATEDTDVDARALQAAADAALEAADVSWFTRQGFMASIPPMCAAIADGDEDRVADRVILLGYDDFTAARLVIGLEAGGQSFCPEDLAEHPGFFEEVARLAGVDLANGVSTTTAPTVTSTTTAPTTTTKPTPTTARRSTPAPTPTAPATTVPPTTTAPTTTAPTTTTTVEEPTTTAP